MHYLTSCFLDLNRPDIFTKKWPLCFCWEWGMREKIERLRDNDLGKVCAGVDYLGESLSVKFQQQSLLIPLVHTGKNFFKFVQKDLIVDTYFKHKRLRVNKKCPYFSYSIFWTLSIWISYFVDANLNIFNRELVSTVLQMTFSGRLFVDFV